MLSGARVPRRAAKEISDGTENQCVIRSWFTARTGDRSWPRCGTTSVPPRAQATNRSCTDPSKVRSKLPETLLPGPISYRDATCST